MPSRVIRGLIPINLYFKIYILSNNLQKLKYFVIVSATIRKSQVIQKVTAQIKIRAPWLKKGHASREQFLGIFQGPDSKSSNEQFGRIVIGASDRAFLKPERVSEHEYSLCMVSPNSHLLRASDVPWCYVLNNPVLLEILYTS